MTALAPVRLVVLNHDGGAHLERCISRLLALDWPPDQLEVVVVDNASSDGSADDVERRHPEVRVERNATNAGFPGNNTALRDLSGVRYVGLVNNDAFVEPGWLAPLVAALDADEGLGAVNGTLLFDAGFVDLRIEGPSVTPSRRDPRRLGVRVSGLRVDGEDRWRRTLVLDGGWGPEPTAAGGVAEWTQGWARVAVPVVLGPSGAGSGDGADRRWSVDVELSAADPHLVRLDGGAGEVEVEVSPVPAWFGLEVTGAPYEVVNNAGNAVRADGYGVDRGFGVVRAEWPAEPTELFAWCGGAVLLRPAYLEQVGLFEESFFLYYEDVDLSWRGRARGWRYAYVPDAVARHVHAASGGVASATAMGEAERNRLLVLVRNAPASMVVAAIARFVTATASYARRGPGPGDGSAPGPIARRRLGALGRFVRALPAALAQRRRLRGLQRVPDEELVAGLVRDRPT
ncbi:MAG TPA: glycosyltransferase [Acidimicrobiales bacterium]|nr:glycosyltransferase [Acidimicrobiales bacterium]